MNTVPIRTYRTQIGDGQIRIMHIQSHDDQLHRHIFFELVYVIGGSATHHLDGKATRLHAGDYYIIDTGTAHCYQDAVNFEIVNCLFLPEYIDRALVDCPSLLALLSNQVLRFGVPVDIHIADRTFHDTDGTVRRIIKAMEQEYSARGTGYMELLRCHLTQVLVHAVRACEEVERTHISHSAITAIADYLRMHYHEPLSLETLSRLVGYTPQYLSGLFRRNTGMTIREFLQKLRLENACRLMAQKTMSIPDIARTVGYGDAKHFSRVFRRYKGISPSDFRKTLM